jgi:hypothetical protein
MIKSFRFRENSGEKAGNQQKNEKNSENCLKNDLT